MQPNSLHIDLRAMNSVQFYPPYQSVRIGSGALWKNVLNVVDPKVHTVIHGNVSFKKNLNCALLCRYFSTRHAKHYFFLQIGVQCAL